MPMTAVSNSSDGGGGRGLGGEGGGIRFDLLLVIPGIASHARAANCAANVHIILRSSTHLALKRCLAFTHKRLGEDAKLDRALEAPSPLSSVCELVRASNREPGGGFADHLKRVLPAFVEDGAYGGVFVLFDDVALPAGFDMHRLVAIARAHRLHALSLAVRGSSYAPRYPIMEPRAAARRPSSYAVGRLTKFFEFFAFYVSPPAWRCLWSLLDATNGIGWGYDKFLYKWCRRQVAGGFRMGILDDANATHGDGRPLPLQTHSSYARDLASKQHDAMRATLVTGTTKKRLTSGTFADCCPVDCWLCYPLQPPCPCPEHVERNMSFAPYDEPTLRAAARWGGKAAGLVTDGTASEVASAAASPAAAAAAVIAAAVAV